MEEEDRVKKDSRKEVGGRQRGVHVDRIDNDVAE